MISFENLFFGVTLFAALGCGLMAGLFFVFSVAVMKALASLPPAQGNAAMQAINVAILNPWFGLVFFGTTLASILLVILSLWRWQTPGALYALSGSLLYLIGSFLITLVFNVPLNQTLASAPPADADAARLWASYRTRWTRWNHLRTVITLAASLALILALCS